MEHVETALAHIGRTAYSTYDNPYLRAIMGQDLGAEASAVLSRLGDESFSVSEWLVTPAADELLTAATVGIVPRDVQLVVREEGQRVAVQSVHAFLRAPLFWWVVSHLWCITTGRAIDARLSEQVMGYRFSRTYAEAPASSPRMFRSPSDAYNKWRHSSGAMSAEFEGALLGTATIDIQNFYYSAIATPSKIVRTFETALELSVEEHQLMELLDALHARYAEEVERVRPRPEIEGPETIPLPVGLPSSQVLANIIMAVALRDLRRHPAVVGASAYADDLLVLSADIPEVDEPPTDYFLRLGIVERATEVDPAFLASPEAQQLALMMVSTDKSETSYSRVINSDDGHRRVAAEPDELEPLDPYVTGQPSGDWGGRLRTVLRSPHRRERVPRELSKDLRRLTDDIRAGIEPLDALRDMERLLARLDDGQFLALRPFWPALIACAWYAEEGPAVDGLNNRIDAILNALAPPSSAGQTLIAAIDTGLRDAWGQALAEAWALQGTRGADATNPPTPTWVTTATNHDVAEILSRARRLRHAGFIDAKLVTVPLAELTNWTGPLFGSSAFGSFVEFMSNPFLGELDVTKAKRFVHLHEACVPTHLWYRPASPTWLGDVFGILSSQPLIDVSMLTDLRARAEEALRITSPRVERAASLRDYHLRVAIPSIEVSGGEQLAAVMSDDKGALSKIRRTAHRTVAEVTRTAVRKRANLMVLPEWSTVATQLSWLFSQARSAQMMVIAGEAPRVHGTTFSNRLWTGIPFTDANAHRGCLVPPPREKMYLSPHEATALKKNGKRHVPNIGPAPVYSWRGISFASLICFEFADVRARDQLRSQADFLTVSSWNTDWRYFGAAQEATTRDNYCMSLCVNTSQFPGTALMRPTRSAMAVAAAVHGSNQATIVTRDVDMLPIVLARASGRSPSEIDMPQPRDDMELSNYAALPPTFEP